MALFLPPTYLPSSFLSSLSVSLSAPPFPSSLTLNSLIPFSLSLPSLKSGSKREEGGTEVGGREGGEIRKSKMGGREEGGEKEKKRGERGGRESEKGRKRNREREECAWWATSRHLRGGGPGRPPCWRTLEESCKGLGSVSLKKKQPTHTPWGQR